MPTASVERVQILNEFQDVKEHVSLKDYAASKLKPVGTTYVCPCCGSKKTPAFSIKGEQWKCFSCYEGGDVFDLAAKVEGIADDDKRAQLEAVADWAGYSLDHHAKSEAPAPPKKLKSNVAEGYTQGREEEASYVEQSRLNINHPEAVSYLESRGISLKEAQDKGLGYDKHARRLVIPWVGCDYYHADRDVTGKSKAKYKYPKEERVGGRPLYNPSALKAEVVFVVEGPLDALAVDLCGYQAIALGSNRNRKLADAMNAAGYSGVVVLALDDDDKGREGARDTAAQLDALGITYVEAKFGGCKDAAEAYKSDKEGLKRVLEEAQDNAIKEKERRESSEYAKTLEALRVFNPLDVASKLWDVENLMDPVSTGMANLDELLGGGLPRGLIVLGALSSIGKTTYTLQIADDMAERGVPVLFVTIEQSAQEIVAKSLSRIMRQRFGRDSWYVASPQEIVSRKRRELWGEKEQLALYGALESYTLKVADNLRIFEGRKQPTVADIRSAAEVMRKRHGQSPVVFIDYLQLMAPSNDRDGTKEATDHNITELRQLSRELQTPVFVISSLNRASYGKGVSLDSYKESGAIEYGADVLLGLQPAGMTAKLDDIPNENLAKKAADRIARENKSKQVRECELVVLKQRNGRMPENPLTLTFYAASCLFEERVKS